MMQSILFFMIVAAIYGSIEYYGWQAVKTAFKSYNVNTLKWVYWGFSLGLIALFMLYRPLLYKYLPRSISSYMGAVMVIVLFAKLIVVLFLLPEDLLRLVRTAAAKVTSNPPADGSISRSVFLSRMALITAAIPAGTLIYGIVANAYNYQFRKVKVKAPNLPEAFNGFRIIQLSDIHSGSFTRKEPIKEVVERINALNADLILFTGDLVNNVADEMDEYKELFGQLRAKHGVMSVTGNHDYGDYVPWETMEAKQANFKKFMDTHHVMGWDLLMNTNRVLERNGEKIAIIGVENCGGGRFKHYGNLDVAYAGTENIPFKVLMSHDPSHWDREVRPKYNDIDLMLSGHTHGAQFGVENKWLKWSPSEYMYKQWAGLYKEGAQHLYVNRGFGFLFYPGRVGILPEVTEITLEKA